MIVKKLIENCWMLTGDTGEKIGIARQIENIFVVSSLPEKQFTSLEAVANHFGEEIEQDENKQNVTVEPINGYPVKHNCYHNVDTVALGDVSVSFYTKTEKSSVQYAAGYYTVKFESGWASSFCPKRETLEQNEWSGPFKSEFDMRFELSRLNQKEQ